MVRTCLSDCCRYEEHIGTGVDDFNACFWLMGGVESGGCPIGQVSAEILKRYQSTNPGAYKVHIPYRSGRDRQENLAPRHAGIGADLPTLAQQICGSKCVFAK